MDQNIKQQAAQELLNWMKAAGDVVKEQAPATVHDMLTAGYITNSLTLMVCVILTSGLGYRSYRMIRYAIEHDDAGGYSGTTGLVASGFALLSLVFLLDSLYGLLIIHFAPRVYILEQLSALAK